MRKFLAGIFLACAALFSPSPAHAWPITVPYQIAADTWSLVSVVLSTTNFPSPVPAINANVVNDQWCISHLAVSSPNLASNVTIAWSTSTLTAATTDFFVVTHNAGIPYDSQWGVQSPYCAPVGKTILTITSSVAGSTVAVEGFLWKGYAP